MRQSSVIIVAALLVAPAAQACNVPVFRFALERWKPDNHEIIVFHRGKLTMPQQETVDLLKRFGPGEEKPSNIDLTIVDLDNKPDPAAVELYAEIGKPALPWLIVRSKNLERETVITWSSKVDEESVRGVVDSPIRQKIAKRLAGGLTAQWLFLESGDKKKDEAALELLEKELRELSKKLKLPELTESPEDRLNAKGPPLMVSFSVLVIKRDDPSEEFLRKALLKTEEDLESKKEPMAFAVFGRGRSLPAMMGAGITAEHITADCKLLVGPCSCKVKGQMPGFDLLLSKDWDAIFEPIQKTDTKPHSPEEDPPITTNPLTMTQMPLVEAPKSKVAPARPSDERADVIFTPLLYAGIVLSSLLVVVTGIRLFRPEATA